VSLTVGSGPFGHRPTGRFDFDAPRRITFVEVHRPRVRGIRDGETVVDSDRVRLVYRTGTLPRYAFPAEDVHGPSEPEPAVEGYVTVAWDAVDRWLEEDAERIVHPHDPYHRITVLPSSRHVVVRIGGETVADSTRPRILFETGLPPRYYVLLDDVRRDALRPADGVVTGCAYKGWASYLDVGGAEAVAWVFDEPLRDGEPVRGLVCFFQERDEVEVEVDGVVVESPPTQWSGTDWISRYRRAA
jgi:uncharacterized protein (DUF427 family)